MTKCLDVISDCKVGSHRKTWGTDDAGFIGMRSCCTTWTALRADQSFHFKELII